ncbi:MAG: alpha/beta hydrolase [Phycisphaerae bacterium]|nr:alpha/beta hydrolase [Phycisphaerae bacterium]MDW8261362.1 alpha/beta hydrolase [Phycisphaerales bacterium]
MFRRLVLSLLLLGLMVAVASFTAFYTRNFTGVGPTPQRLAFARRLPGVDEGEYRRCEFFFATNRSFRGEDEEKSLADQITYGKFSVRISGKIPIAPWVWQDATYMRWVGRSQCSQEDFLAELRQHVMASPHRSILVIVWGWKDRFLTAALKTAYTAYALDIHTPVLLFDWPGNQGNRVAGYLASRQMAHRSGADLGRLLAELIRHCQAENIWIMGSSLGCQTICDAFSWMMSQTDLADAEPEIGHVILSAPDVSQHEFDARFAEELRALSRYTTVYVSSNDQALLLSELINRGRRLGRQPVARPDEPADQVDEATDLLELKTQGAEHLSLVDATPVNNTRNLHHFFTDSPEFFDDVYRQLLQPGSSISRRLYPVKSEQGASFWILWRD